MKLHTGDPVVVIAGKDKGKTGNVLRVLRGAGRVVVESINMRTRHIRKTPQQAGQKIRYEASIAVSNVMVLDPKMGKPTRVRFLVDEKGRKRRQAVRSEVFLEEVKATPMPKPSVLPLAAMQEQPRQAPPVKQPFWKRWIQKTGMPGTAASLEPASGVETIHPTTTITHRSRESSGS